MSPQAAAPKRIRRFCAGASAGGALINIDLHGSSLPLAPRTHFPRWGFPWDLRRCLDEQVALLLETWEHKRGLEDAAVPSLYPRFGVAEHSAFAGGEVEFGAPAGSSWLGNDPARDGRQPFP